MIRWDRSKGRPEPIAALNKIAERENGEPLVYLPDVAPHVRVPRETTIAYCRETVAHMAEKAALSLPEGYHLAVTDSFRPFDRQVKIFEMMWRFGYEAFPDLSYAQMRRKICRWVAPVDQKAPPGHCTGAALDVVLEDDAGELIDVASPYDRFTAAPTYCLDLSPEAHRNRMILVDAMLGAGFSNCRDEWWHYSYGDAGWAVRMGETECIYGLVELPVELYARQQEIWEESLKERQNPFLALPKT